MGRGVWEDPKVTATRVALIEDDAALRRILSRRLQSAGHTVHALEAAGVVPKTMAGLGVEVVIVDVERETDAQEWLERSRGLGDMVMIALLPVGTPESVAFDVLDAGADAVVTKPFSPREVLSKLNALSRRLGNGAAVESKREFDGLVIDCSLRQVSLDGREIEMPAREFDLLAFLSGSPRQVFTRGQLLRQVWGSEVEVGVATVTEHIRRLRLRIEADPRNPRRIVTVRSVGYRFNP
jgi:DNA-binding response OmpR family regulator